MLYLDLPRPKKFGDSRRRQHLYTPEGGAAGAMDCFTPQAIAEMIEVGCACRRAREGDGVQGRPSQFETMRECE